MQAVQLGLTPYQEASELQRALVERRKAGAIGDVLLLLEHTPVITLGRNAKETNILESREKLAARGVEVFECDRGGDVTYHGPGQLVGYPIVDLRGFSDEQGRRKTLGPVEFVRRMEEALMNACGELGVPCARIQGLTGVWTAGAKMQAKIAAIGVHISRGVTSHGFALNVNSDLDAFKAIVPCGIADRPVTSLQKELGRSLDLESTARVVARHLGEVFRSELQWLESLDALLGPAPEDTPLSVPEEVRKLTGEDEIFLA